MYSPAASLTDPPTDSPIADGVNWIQGVALGTTATTVAILAVAAIGLLMLSGRLELRRGITVVIGCFILFGAAGTATILTNVAGVDKQPSRSVSTPPSPQSDQLRPPASEPAAYDPYAGASVPQASQR
jgi:type IV secretory pathway VirB2 component (pilin)